VQSPSRASGIPAKQGHGHCSLPSDRASQLIAAPWSTLALWASKLCDVLHSLREHIRIEFSTSSVDLGAAFSPQGAGWLPNTRTIARAEGIRTLQAIRPKVDIADIQMFLAGFDAGEQYALDRGDSPPHSSQGAQHIQQPPLESSDTAISQDRAIIGP
jgi:hypothetical protein